MTAAPRGEAGFTLIEMIVVVAVLGLAAGVLVGRGPTRSPTVTMKATAQAVASAARLARSQAVATNRPVQLTLDTAAHTLQIGTAAPVALAPEIAIAVTSAAVEARGPARAGIRFLGDGSATGGKIALSDGRRGATVSIDWLTGRVSVADRL